MLHALPEAVQPARRYMTPRQVSALTGLSTSFLCALRSSGDGPAFMRVGRPRSKRPKILYDRLRVERWLEARTVETEET